jgi:hypothetical protein
VQKLGKARGRHRRGGSARRVRGPGSVGLVKAEAGAAGEAPGDSGVEFEGGAGVVVTVP